MFGKIIGGLAAVGGLMQGCADGITNGAEKVGDLVNPATCEHAIDGTTGTTIVDGTTFGVRVMPDGTRALTRTLGECRR